MLYLRSSRRIWAGVQPTNSAGEATLERCIRLSNASNGSLFISVCLVMPNAPSSRQLSPERRQAARALDVFGTGIFCGVEDDHCNAPQSASATGAVG
jgi:hypothetical protein